MPAVKQAQFRCPTCGKPMKVLRTRVDERGRLVRYRQCTTVADHRVTTRELPIGESATPEHQIGTTRLGFALRQFAESFGISLDTSGPTESQILDSNSKGSR